MKTRSFQLKACVLILLGYAFVVDARAQVSNYKAYTLFVYNFTKYIQWPDGVIKDEFVIGVYGKSPIQEELQKMVALKKAGDKIIRIAEFSESNLTSEVHILFIPEDKTNQMPTIVAALRGKPVLLVAEKEGTIQKGAGISFMTDQNNLKFELNSTSISNQNLKVSKALEALAFKGPS
jgi:hypothetical protein